MRYIIFLDGCLKVKIVKSHIFRYARYMRSEIKWFTTCNLISCFKLEISHRYHLIPFMHGTSSLYTALVYPSIIPTLILWRKYTVYLFFEKLGQQDMTIKFFIYCRISLSLHETVWVSFGSKLSCTHMTYYIAALSIPIIFWCCLESRDLLSKLTCSIET